MPEWRTPEQLAADYEDWLVDEAIYDDEVSGGAWRRAFGVAPHRGLHWPDKGGLDRRLHPVDGAEDEVEPVWGDGFLEGRLKHHGDDDA